MKRSLGVFIGGNIIFIGALLLLVTVGFWQIGPGNLNGKLSTGLTSEPISTSPSPTPRPKLSLVHTPILMYHYIREVTDRAADPIGYNLSISPTQFEAQIDYLFKLGYNPVTMEQAITGKTDSRSIVLTFDDGYADFYTHAYPILKKYNWVATVYVITGLTSDQYLTRSQIQELSDYGIEIGAHTIKHINLATATPERQYKEIYQSKITLEKLTSKPITTFAYPAGQYSETTIALVKQAGYSSAVTTKAGVASIYDSAFTLPRVRVRPQLTLEELLKEIKGL